MKNKKLINFIKKDKNEEKYFIGTLTILIYLIIFQSYTQIQSIKSLEEEVKNNKTLIQSKELVNTESKRYTLVEDSNKIYNLLGFENVNRISVEKGKVEIEGQCDNLDVLNEIKSIDNVENFSITNVENKNNNFYFNVTYEIGGFE